MRDDSDVPARRKWNRIKILTTVGYSAFTNSEHIVNEFWSQRLDQAPTTIFQTAITDYLQPAGVPGIFYLRSLHETEAGRKLTRRIQREEQRGIRCIVADPAESSVQSLAWQAQQIYSSDAVVAHLCSPTRAGADVHNARCALISGLAVGMGKRLLMLAEEDYVTPIDYRDLLHVYGTAKDCQEHADAWLDQHLAPAYDRLRSRPSQTPRTELAIELRSLRIGDPIAENEAEDLAEYFVETASFQEVMDKKTTVFVGPKGSGKTANLIRAADRLRADKRNLVCVIKPFSYELEGVVALMRRYKEKARQGYLVESLWKFLIYSEIANSTYAELKERSAAPIPGSAEYHFVEFMEREGAFLREEFAVRLEAAIEKLLELEPTPTLGQERVQVSAALHEGVLRELRGQLGRILSKKQRVAVLVDNLDKAWQRSADIEQLALFLLGLLSSVGRISDEFARRDHWREPVLLTLAVFLRADIFAHVSRVAREPDKIPVSLLSWTDGFLLLRLIEERYEAWHSGASPGEVWTRFFCSTVRGKRTPDYLLRRVLPKPRDLIYLCSAAIAAAVNRRSSIVEEEDIVKAETLYSQFALESLHVEKGVSIPQLEEILYEFAGGPAVVERAQLAQYVRGAGMGDAAVDEVIEHLYAASFLGLEIREDAFAFADDLRRPGLADALARRLAAESPVGPRFQVHPAFRPYLEILKDRL